MATIIDIVSEYDVSMHMRRVNYLSKSKLAL